MGTASKGYGREGMTKVRKPSNWRKIKDTGKNRKQRRTVQPLRTPVGKGFDMRVDVEQLLEFRTMRKIVNAVDLESIRWFKNGLEIIPTKECIEEFKFTGLSNMDFIDDDGDFLVPR